MIPKRNQTLPNSVTIMFFGVLLAASLLLNIGIFLKLDNTIDPNTDLAAPQQFNSELDRQVINGKVWVKLQDPIFEANFLTDPTCTICTDLSQQEAAFKQAFPTANIRMVELNSERGKKLLDAGVSVIPAIVLSKSFQNIQNFNQWAQGGFISPISEDFFEFRTNGNKKILNSLQLPQLPEGEQALRLISYVDYFAPETVAFVSSTAQQIISQFGQQVIIDVRPFVKNIPTAFAAEAVACGAPFAKVAAVRDQYFEAVNNIVSGKQELNEADINQISSALSNLLGLEEEQAQCYTEHRYADTIQQISAETQRLGITGAPAFFIGNRFLAGQQDANVFIEAISTVLSEKGTQPPAATQPEGDSTTNPETVPPAETEE